MADQAEKQPVAEGEQPIKTEEGEAVVNDPDQ